MSPLLDSLDRPLRSLRVSITDRCNLRCRYCMPREVFGRSFEFMEHSDMLSFEEIVRLVRLFANQGVSAVRLTGGEPLLRRDVEQLIEQIAAIEQIEDLSLTTNGTLLARKAQSLADAGLQRVTVSLDALDQESFQAMTDTPVSVERVLAGIDAAHAAGLGPVKVNMVVRRGINDDCVLPMAEHFRNSSEILRFIEFMDVGESNGWKLDEVVTAAEIRERIEARWPLEALPARHAGEVATRYRYRDGAGELGFIHSVSEPFCSGCTRARLSAEGKLFNCLFASGGHDLRALLRSGASDPEIERTLAGIWGARTDRYSELRTAISRRQEAGGATNTDGSAADGGNAPAAAGTAGRGGRAKIEMSYIGG